jgi:acyl-CoA synthetase (AMP-forming)/AMP-acid ligase II
MSVLNTHLAAGATLVVTTDGLVTRPFWDAVDGLGVTTLPLVPTQFEMLRQMRFDPTSHPSLRSVTQAGGRLATQSVIEFHERLATIGASLFVMYGQTEGGPRLTTLPPARLPAKAGSVGPAVPGGAIQIEAGQDESGSTPTGEVVYRGPNVMMGYADEAADLARGDDTGGVLHTGDLGHLDDEGYLTIDGRRSRLGKAFGIRLNLDDVEGMLAGLGAIAAIPGDDRVIVWVEGNEPDLANEAVSHVARRLRIHPTGFVVRTTDRLPLLPNGKVDYQLLGRSS